MNRSTRIVAGAVVVALACAAVYAAMAARSAGKDPARASQPEVTLQFQPQEVVQPGMATLPDVIEFSGPLVAPGTAVVRAKTGGTLVALEVLEGQRVRAGQTLGRVEMADQASRLAERGAAVDGARTAVAQAERTHASNERLAQQQFISPLALDNSRSALEAARAQLAQAQAALETTRAALRETTLVAPIGGVVSRRQALPGEKVAPEQAVLTIVDLQQLELAGTVGTHQVSRLAAGTAVQVRIEGQREPLAARIARIAPAAEPGTRSIGVTVSLPNPGERLRAGQYALARVVLRDDVPGLTLPASAVGSTAGQDHVWIIDGGRLVRRAVTLGRRDESSARVEVLSGLQPGQTVLAARFDNLREGAAAQVVAQRAAAASSPAP